MIFTYIVLCKVITLFIIILWRAAAVACQALERRQDAAGRRRKAAALRVSRFAAGARMVVLRVVYSSCESKGNHMFSTRAGVHL